MADDNSTAGEYLHAFTLYQDPKKGKDTSPEARKAYTDALKEKGFRPDALHSSGKRAHLPKATMVGTFPNDKAAIAAVNDAETAAEAADPGKFFRESAVLTSYRRLRLVGPAVAAPAAAKPATAASKPTRADGILAAILDDLDPKRG